MTEHQHQSLLSIQVLRACAALGVTIPHLVGYEFVRKQGLIDALPGFTLGYAGVDVFFVISGFVMVYSSEPLFERANAAREFVLRRLARIVPLYWITTSLILAYLLVHYGDLSTAKFSWRAVVGSYLFIPVAQTDGYMAPVHGVGWTLNYEMFFYVCFSLALLFSRRTGVLLVAAALTLFAAVNLVAPLPNPFGYWADPIILEFVFGMLIALGFRNGIRMPRPIAAGALLLALGAIAASTRWADVHRVIAWGVPSAVIVAALVLSRATAKPGPVQRGLNLLGNASYSLYLVHPWAITLPRRFFPQLLNPAQWPWLAAALVLAFTLGLSLLVHLLVERPITRKLQRQVTSWFRDESRMPPAGDQHSLPERQANMPVRP
ncbi:MAG TPA: acyltransferase [Xanthobacteraceae bacterium]